ncbi:hypothetical protein ABZ746_17290 [Streptomyces sp. NPDC020096]
MLTNRPRRATPYTLTTGMTAALAMLLASQHAAADDGHFGFSSLTCAKAECQLTAGTTLPPAELSHSDAITHPADHPGVRSNQSNPSPAVPANCWLANLDGTCLETGQQGPQPAPQAAQHQPTPEAVARQAVSQLRLPSPQIRMNPDAAVAQVVRVPTWMWIDRADWQPVSQRAEVPGVEVTATATPQRVVWTMGDGGSVTCAGSGTPYSSRFPAASLSPDCGYVYRRSSAGQPGEAFTVTATIVWDVVWHGGGRGGTVRGLESRAQLPVRVSEVQAVVVTGAGSI